MQYIYTYFINKIQINMKTIKAYDYSITPIYIKDLLYITTKLSIVSNDTEEQLDTIELCLNNENNIRDFKTIGSEETIAYLLLKPFFKKIIMVINQNDFEWEEFVKSNESFMTYMYETIIERIKEVMKPNSEYVR